MLGEKLALDASTNYAISSLFWMIYLFAKHLNNESETLEIMTTLMPILIE